MIEELKQKLGDEVQRLQHELNVVLPAEIRKAVELGDLRENSEYKAALERQQFVQARLGQLRQRLSKLSQIDLTQIPTDKVGLGSRVVVEDQQTKSTETYSLVFGDSVEFEEGHVSMGSLDWPRARREGRRRRHHPQAARHDSPASHRRAGDHPPGAPA